MRKRASMVVGNGSGDSSNNTHLAGSSSSSSLSVGSGTAINSSSSSNHGGSGGVDFVWEYEDDNGWAAYSWLHQTNLEAKFQELHAGTPHRRRSSSSSLSSKVPIKTDEWRYEVDVRNMTQTNVEHTNRRQRSVRRRQIGISYVMADV